MKHSLNVVAYLSMFTSIAIWMVNERSRWQVQAEVDRVQFEQIKELVELIRILNENDRNIFHYMKLKESNEVRNLNQDPMGPVL